MPKEPKRKWGCLTIGISIVLGFVVLNFGLNWWSTRPKQMLNRFLDVAWSEDITRLETDFIGGMDFTAHIYLEADVATIEGILAGGNFTKTLGLADARRITQLNFEGAPDSRPETLTHYEKHEGTVLEYAAVSSDGLRLWYGAFDY